MRFAICALALLACAALIEAEKISRRPGHLYEMRRRLGHFKEKPYINLYENYAAAFILPKHPERAKDDDRNFSPHAQECVLFFTEYRNNKYQVKSLDQFVVLDACLGYLFESNHHEVDEEKGGDLVKANLQRFKDDPTLKEFFDKTQINSIPDEAQHCVADLLLSAILMKVQYAHENCNNKWIQLFLQFADCHKSIPQELRQEDSYIKTIYQIVRDETHRCFDHEIHFLNEVVRKTYKKSTLTRFSNKLGYTSLQKQQAQRMWPSYIRNLLKVIQGAKHEISLRQVHLLLRGYYLDDPKLKKIFLDNVAKYATKEIRPRSSDSKGDPSGEERYKDLVVNKLCNFFRTADREGHPDFATSFVRLVQLLNHEDVFDLSFQQFIERILTKSFETSSLYLSISACNILTFTQGHVVIPEGNGKVVYEVEPVPDTSLMVRWPDAGYY